MRTSLRQQVQSSLMHLDTASRKLTEAQQMAVSGKRILRPSMDVPGTRSSLSLRSAINTNNQLTNNIDVSAPLVKTTLGAVEDIVKHVQSLRDITIASANPDATGNARKAYLAQVDNIMSSILDAANTQHIGMYVFSGTATDTPPLTDSASGTSPYDYAGSEGVRKVQVLSWVTQPVNIPGSEVFNFNQSAGAGTTDLFTMVKNLRDAIDTGDNEQISGQLENIDANLDNLLACAAKLGAWSARMENAKATLEDSSIRLKTMLSDTEDIDLPEAVIELKTQENVYQAALAISSQMLDLSLASLKYL